MWTAKQRLVLTNTGSHDRMKPGFLYCPKCGRAEPNGWSAGKFQQGGHPRPNPDHNPYGPSCNGTPTVIVLGNEFETDIALFRFYLGGAVAMPPGSTVAKIVLTTVAEALAAAAAKVLDIEESDVGAEFRVAMTSGGRTGRDVEVYLYDLTPAVPGLCARRWRIQTASSTRRSHASSPASARIPATSACAATRTSGITSISTATRRVVPPARRARRTTDDRGRRRRAPPPRCAST